MSNMRYCMFENVYHDLLEAQDKFYDQIEDLSDTEAEYRKALLKLCKEIAEEFGDENEDSE